MVNFACMAGAAVEDRRAVTAQVIDTVRRFVEREVIPVASKYEHADEYPQPLVDRMRELGLFGATIPVEYGGLGLDYTTYAMIVEELCRGWMSLSGVLNTHLMFAYVLQMHGTPEQQVRYLPAMARGEQRAALCLTEPHAGSDAQRIRTTAVRRGDHYVVNGSKMFITNARTATIYSLVAKTEPNADPPYKGISLFAAEKDAPGVTVGRQLDKLGYKGVETCEVSFEDFRVPAGNLVGGVEGRGFAQVMSGLEVGRINIAARAVEAARLLTRQAAAMKDRGERVDVEAGMAKLFASETCQEVSLEAMRILGGYGYVKEFPVERYYRDAPLMIIGEGTNEIQRLVIARSLVQRYKIW